MYFQFFLPYERLGSLLGLSEIYLTHASLHLRSPKNGIKRNFERRVDKRSFIFWKKKQKKKLAEPNSILAHM